MFHYVAMFVVMAMVAAMIGFTDRDADAMEIAKISFIVLHLLFGAALLMKFRTAGDASQK